MKLIYLNTIKDDNKYLDLTTYLNTYRHGILYFICNRTQVRKICNWNQFFGAGGGECYKVIKFMLYIIFI